MDVMDLYRLVVDFYGAKATDKRFDSVKKSVSVVLYETFSLRFSANDRHGEFGGVLIRSDGTSQATFLGKTLSLNSDEASIRESLAIVDDWCRLQLTDKFLDAFEASI